MYYTATKEVRERILSEQGGKCKICATPMVLANPHGKSHKDSRRAYLDHCHRSGKIRAMLCGNCNAGIGQFHEDINTMLKAIEYIKEYRDRTN